MPVCFEDAGQRIELCIQLGQSGSRSRNQVVPMHRSTKCFHRAAELKRDRRTSSIQPPPRSRWSQTRLLFPVLHLPIAKETPQSFWTACSWVWASSQGEIFLSVENFLCAGLCLWPLILSLGSSEVKQLKAVARSGLACSQPLPAADVIPRVGVTGPGDTRHGLFSRAVGLRPGWRDRSFPFWNLYGHSGKLCKWSPRLKKKKKPTRTTTQKIHWGRV